MKSLCTVLILCITFLSACQNAYNQKFDEPASIINDASVSNFLTSTLSEPKIISENNNLVELSESSLGMRFNLTYDQFIERYNYLDGENTVPIPFKKSALVEQINGYDERFGIDVICGIYYNLIANTGLSEPVEAITINIEKDSGKICGIGWIITKGRILQLGDENLSRIKDMACFMFRVANNELSEQDAKNICDKIFATDTYYFDYNDNLLYNIFYDQNNDTYQVKITPMSEEAYHKATGQ